MLARKLRVALVCSIALSSSLAFSADEKKPPSITYSGQRSSKTWVETPTGSVAVDDGIEWEGIKVYLSLTWNLVAVDAKTQKTLWSQHVSAFWNGMAIREVEVEPGKKTWAVELRPGPRERQAQGLTALHDLKTGKEIKLPGQAKGLGTVVKPRKEWSGATSNLPRAFNLLVTTADNWTKTRERMFTGLDKAEAPLAKDIDFEKEVVLVVSHGDSWNCRGLGCAEAFQDDQRILFRLAAQTYQTSGGGVRCRPYGICVLPRVEKKAYVVERNRQRYIGGPPLWEEMARFEQLPDAAKELDRLPQR